MNISVCGNCPISLRKLRGFVRLPFSQKQYKDDDESKALANNSDRERPKYKEKNMS
jgi:hypothetical protein